MIYAHQWQRELPSRRMMHHFNRLTPEKTVTIDDIEFVRIYDMAGAPHADYTVDFGGAIRLVYYDTYSGVMLPGQKYDMTIYWDKIAPIDINANVLVRLVDQDGHQLMRIEGWPKGVATAKWEMGELLRDNNYEVRIPEGTPPGLYRIEVSIYDPATLDNLPVTSANTGEVLAQPYVLDYLIVGDLPEKPAYAINPQADFGGRIELFGADLQDAAGKPLRERDQRYLPGDTVNLRLFWRACPICTRLYCLRPRDRPGRADGRAARSAAVERLHPHFLLAAAPGHRRRLRPHPACRRAEATTRSSSVSTTWRL